MLLVCLSKMLSQFREIIDDFSLKASMANMLNAYMHVCICVVHQIYVGTESEKQPFFLSVVLTDSNNQGAPQYKAILWKKTVHYRRK